MKTILLLERDPSLVSLLQYHLEAADLDGLLLDGPSELRELRSTPPTGAILDMDEPDAASILQALRSDGDLGSVPLLLLSTDGAGFEGASDGDWEFLTKPFSGGELMKTLAKMMSDAELVFGPGNGGPKKRKDLITMSVSLLLDEYSITGDVHLPRGLDRFSEAWEAIVNDPRTYFPVTDAVIADRRQTTTTEVPFVAIRKVDVRGIFPAPSQPDRTRT